MEARKYVTKKEYPDSKQGSETTLHLNLRAFLAFILDNEITCSLLATIA